MARLVLFLSLGVGYILLSACDNRNDEQPTSTDPALSAPERADNPLLNLQDETSQKAEDAINEAVAKQQQALDSIEQ